MWLLKLRRTLWGSWTWKLFCPWFIICREQTPASMTFPDSQRADLNSCSSGKGEDAEARKGDQRNRSSAFGQVLVPPPGTHMTTSLSSSAKLEPPTNGRHFFPSTIFLTATISHSCWASLSLKPLIIPHIQYLLLWCSDNSCNEAWEQT